jgi:vWA-MoxR associated protein middle region (VMAP-M) 2
MRGPVRRHLLVIASQCDAMPPLSRLDEAANALDQALRNHGDCEPGLAEDRSLLCGAFSAADINGRVEDAAIRAAEQGAVLVLALLGHGFTPGLDPRLHFMGKQSRPDRTIGACDVRKLVLDITGTRGIAGAIVIIDTCMAAGGAPDPGALAAREQPGGTRLAMLMGASAEQEGYDLVFTRSLAKILESGVPGADEHLTFGDLKPLLEEQVRHQDLSHFGWNSARKAGPLWLARNNAAAQLVLGRARGDLQEALARALGPEERVPRRWDPSEFARLGLRLRSVPESAEVDRALELVGDLTTAFKTERFIQHWLGDQLTTGLLRRGLQSIDRVDLPEIVEVRDATEYIALEYPPRDRDCRRLMARFVVAVGREAGKDPRCDELRDWAKQVHAVLQLNDAIAEYDRLPPMPGSRLRLIVSLHGSITDGWPAQVQAWLQHGDQRLAEGVFGCPGLSESATSSAVIQAVRWGGREARSSDRRLQRIEIAAPEEILHSWCPEELKFGRLLGLQFDVALRWSKRISPPSGLEWSNDAARKQLEQIAAYTGSAPVAWLASEAADDLAALEHQLVHGRYDESAIGLDHAPPSGELLGLLLSHSPIVLWPRLDSGLPEEARERVHRHWHRLPGALNDACRARLRNRPSEVPANLRAVWDDFEWLDFCDHFTPLQVDHGSAG